MKGFFSQLVQLAEAYLVQKCTSRQISFWQDWLRALADALPAFKAFRVAEKSNNSTAVTAEHFKAIEAFAKQQEKIDKEIASFADFVSERVDEIKRDEECKSSKK